MTRAQKLSAIIRMARKNLLAYVYLFNNPETSTIKIGRLHSYLLGIVQGVHEGDLGNYQAISVSPQHGKSTMLSMEAVSWIMGKRPGIHVAITGHRYDLMVDFSMSVKARTEHPLYRRVFPEADGIVRGRNKANDWTLANGSTLRAKTVGSKLTGNRVDWLIVDDPHAGREEAESETMRRRVQRWYFGDCITRLAPGAKVFLIACLTGETLVTMWDGTRKRIDTIVAGDIIAQHKDGKRVKAFVEAQKSQGLDVVYEIKTGNHTVRANAHHPWLVDSGSGLVWTRTDALRKGSKIVCSGVEHIDAAATLTEQEAWAIGFMLGDGWVTINKKRNKRPDGTTYPTQSYVTCVAAKKCQEKNERMLQFLEDKFGRRPKLTKFGYYRFEVASAGRWFLSQGISGGAKGKRIIHSLFTQPIDIRKSLVRGFVDADGHTVKDRGRHYAYSCNRELMKDLRAMVRSCGMAPSNIHSRVKMIQAPHSKQPLRSEGHSFGWQDTVTGLEFHTATVRTVTKMEDKEEVFDIQVSGEASFIADGLVSHNTRWHPNDLIGHLTQEEYVRDLRLSGNEDRIFEVTNLPALAMENDPLGRKPGEALFPELRNKRWLEGVRASLPAYEWDSQYQGQPRSMRSGQVDITKLRRIPLSQVPLDLPRIRGWDLALTESTTADYSVGTMCTWDKARRELYIIDVFRVKMSWSKLKPRFIAKSLRDKLEWNCNKVALEAVSGFEIGLRELQASLAGHVHIDKRNPGRGGKLMRAQGWLNLLEAGKLFLVEAPWNKDFLDELLEFPNAKWDDQVDSVSVSVESLVNKSSLILA